MNNVVEKAVDRAQAAIRKGYSMQIQPNPHVRAIEVFLLRYGAQSDSPLSELETLGDFAGGGIVVAYDDFGRKFKIEITQVDGPQ